SLVSACEIRLLQAACSADALSDVAAGQLEVHAAEVAAEALVGPKCEAQLVADIVEAARLVAFGRRLRVAVRRIADPQDVRPRAPDRTDHARQVLLDVLHAETRDQGQAARL